MQIIIHQRIQRIPFYIPLHSRTSIQAHIFFLLPALAHTAHLRRSLPFEKCTAIKITLFSVSNVMQTYMCAIAHKSVMIHEDFEHRRHLRRMHWMLIAMTTTNIVVDCANR